MTENKMYNSFLCLLSQHDYKHKVKPNLESSKQQNQFISINSKNNKYQRKVINKLLKNDHKKEFTIVRDEGHSQS